MGLRSQLQVLGQPVGRLRDIVTREHTFLLSRVAGFGAAIWRFYEPKGAVDLCADCEEIKEGKLGLCHVSHDSRAWFLILGPLALSKFILEMQNLRPQTKPLDSRFAFEDNP